MSKIAKEIRDARDSDTYDIKGSPPLNENQVKDFVELAFREPLELHYMVRITLVIGAGKLSRQKYDDKLGQWIGIKLRELGYIEDNGAHLSLSCSGAYKFQHDTDKNEKFIHVFPLVNVPSNENAEGADNNEGSAQTDQKFSAEWLCIVSKLETFKQMVMVKMPAWIEKKRCVNALLDAVSKLENVEAKLVRMEMLDSEEQRIIDEVDRDLIEEKTKYLNESMKIMVDTGNLTEAEKLVLLAQVDTKRDAVKAKICEVGDSSEMKTEKLHGSLKQLEDRKAMLLNIQPVQHPVANVKELRNIWRKIDSLKKISDKAGLKGRWSPKLSSAEVESLGELEELEKRNQELASGAQHWFENADELDLRVGNARKTMMPVQNKKASVSAPKEVKASDGWTTIEKKKSGGTKSKNRFAGLN